MADSILPSVETSTKNSTRQSDVHTTTRQSYTESVSAKGGKPKTKQGDTRVDQKKRAQEEAAHREQLLSARNATYVLNYLERKTRFDKDQIRALQRIYKRFKGSSQMDRLRFREMVASLLGITDNIMLDRIFQAFDGDNEGSVSEAEWIIGLSVQFRGTLDQQIAYTYDVYDINGDRSIGREEIANFYRNALYPIKGVLEAEEIDDGINELMELAMRKFDINKDGNIQFSEYHHIVRKDPILLEAFGECLPKERAAVPFISLLDANSRGYKNYLSPPGDIGWSVERERYAKFHTDQHHVGYITDNDMDLVKTESPSAWSSMALQSTKHV